MRRGAYLRQYQNQSAGLFYFLYGRPCYSPNTEYSVFDIITIPLNILLIFALNRSHRGKVVTLSVGLVGLLTLGACGTTLPVGPSVMALPNQGKSFEAFQQDDVVCREYAALQSGSVTQGSIQGYYDAAYAQCMYSKGDSVQSAPGSQAYVTPQPTPEPEPSPQQDLESPQPTPGLEPSPQQNQEPPQPTLESEPPSEQMPVREPHISARFLEAIRSNQSLILLFAHPTVDIVRADPPQVFEENANSAVIVDTIWWHPNEPCLDAEGQTVLRFTISYDEAHKIHAWMAVDSEKCAERKAFSGLNLLKDAGVIAANVLIMSKFRMLRVSIGLLGKFITVEDCLLYILEQSAE